MKLIVLDFDGVGDSKVKKIFLDLLNATLEKKKELVNVVDRFLWFFEVLHRKIDIEKIEKLEEFKRKLRGENVDFLILSSRKVDCDFAISVNSLNPKAKIEKLKKFANEGEVIYYTDSELEIREIKKEMKEEVSSGRIKVKKV